MFSPASSASGSDTSLLPVLAPHVDTLVILPPIVLPTLLNSPPHFLIAIQFTWLTYNFSRNNYVMWASGFELFLESHSFLHHLGHFATQLMLLGCN